MAFGSSVDTLIEIYTNCISLLKAFKHRDAAVPSRRDERNRNKQVQLRKSLKSDRARVQRAYSSAVSEAGSRFERGDGKIHDKTSAIQGYTADTMPFIWKDRARSTLSRVLKRLKAAITNILRTSSQHQQPALDYESLMLLSNASRSETLRTFDQLSRRLGSTPSRNTVVTAPSSPKRRSGHAHSGSTGSSKSSGGSSKKGRKPGSPDPELRNHRSSRSREERHETKPRSAPSPGSPRPQPKPASSGRDKPSSAKDTVPPLRSRTPSRRSPTQTAAPHRLSLASIATDSTKLGEIPERKWTSRYDRQRSSASTLDDAEYYNVAPVFPLKLYEPPVKERRFLGLFRRRP